MDRRIEALKNLGLSDTEVNEVLEADRKIDQGEKLFELTPDQKKAEKKARQADRAPTVYKFTPRERKTNDDKRKIINLLESALLCSEACANIEIANAEREIVFYYNNTKYKITLSAPRS
jgi:hypothetical protein